MKKRMMSGLIAVMVLVVIMVFGIAGTVSAREQHTYVKYVTSVTIEYGDTLWDIAEEYISDGYQDIPSFIEEIKECNHLYTDDIQAGQCLIIPYYVVDGNIEK